MLYESIWRNKWLTTDCRSIEEMAAVLREAADTLDDMARHGVELDCNGMQKDDHARLITSSRRVANEFNFLPVREKEQRDEDPYFDPEVVVS